MEIFKLFGSIFIDNDKANESLESTDKKGKGVMGTLGDMIGTAAKWGAGVVAAGSAAVGGMIAFVNKTSAAADEIDKLSERTGINIEELQRWKYAAAQSGADIGKLEGGIKTLSGAIVNATSGNKAATEAFGKLGLSVDDLKNKSQSDIFDAVVQSLASMEQGAERNALGNAVLGKSYTELMPLLNQGADGIEALKNRADELGLVMSEDAVKANVKYRDTMDDVKASFGAMMTQIGTGVIPVIMLFLDMVLENMPAIQTVFELVFGAIAKLVETFIQGVSWVVQTIREWHTENKATIDAIREGFMQFFAAVIELVQAFIAAFTRFWDKYGDGITRVIRVVLDAVVGVFKGAFNAIQGILKIFTGIFQGDWQKVWDGVRQTFKGTWDAIVSIAKGAVNLVLMAMNSMIRGLNLIKFDIPKWVPIIGGNSWGFNLNEIPLLAKGGDVRRGGMAIVGDAGPELLELPPGARVTPLPLDKEPAPVNNISFADMFRGAVFHIREEADIEKLGEEFAAKQIQEMRAAGVEVA